MATSPDPSHSNAPTYLPFPWNYVDVSSAGGLASEDEEEVGLPALRKLKGEIREGPSILRVPALRRVDGQATKPSSHTKPTPAVLNWKSENRLHNVYFSPSLVGGLIKYSGTNITQDRSTLEGTTWGAKYGSDIRADELEQKKALKRMVRFTQDTTEEADLGASRCVFAENSVEDSFLKFYLEPVNTILSGRYTYERGIHLPGGDKFGLLAGSVNEGVRFPVITAAKHREGVMTDMELRIKPDLVAMGFEMKTFWSIDHIVIARLFDSTLTLEDGLFDWTNKIPVPSTSATEGRTKAHDLYIQIWTQLITLNVRVLVCSTGDYIFAIIRTGTNDITVSTVMQLHSHEHNDNDERAIEMLAGVAAFACDLKYAPEEKVEELINDICPPADRLSAKALAAHPEGKKMSAYLRKPPRSMPRKGPRREHRVEELEKIMEEEEVVEVEEAVGGGRSGRRAEGE
ncbi:hypothetical protein PENSPDRAFT_739480 [Peniophora sp. CONT]|nr:hypothetical protein PENSPDRAFT_739480 [Peniophora sp. CONT]